MVDSPHLALRTIVAVHFLLTVWASMSWCLFNGSYMYMNGFIFVLAIWAVIAVDSVDAILMFMLAHAGSIVMDIIFLGIFASPGEAGCGFHPSANTVNTYRFSLGMAIVNLLLKPLSSFVLYRLYQDRSGVASFPSLSIGDHSRTGYSNMENESTYPRHVETASPYSTVESRPTA